MGQSWVSQASGFLIPAGRLKQDGSDQDLDGAAKAQASRSFFRHSLMGCFIAMTMGFPHVSRSAVGPEDQYKTNLTRAQTVQPLTEFGDQISLRDGRLSFKSMDIEVPGTGPTIRLVRTTTLDDGLGSAATSGNRMLGWELEIPRIKTVASDASATLRAASRSADSPVGWQVQAADMNARCSAFGSPGDVDYPNIGVTFPMTSWWFGYQLVDDMGGEQAVFGRASGLPGSQYTIGTQQNWVFSCLPSTANGQPGEGFLGVSPDGTKYWFNYLSYVDFETLNMEFEDVPPKGYTMVFSLPRKSASLLVTRIEDRFGNWLTYNYEAGRLISIQASDGRVVSLSNPDGNITAVTVGTGTSARTWSYSYGSPSTLTLPDGSSWKYEGNFARQFASPFPFETCDQIYSGEPSGSRQVSVTAPSGAVATYVLNRRMIGRSYVPRNCSHTSLMNPNGGFSPLPKLWVGYAIATKTVIGPGVTQSWGYSYSPHNASWKEDCATSTSCISTVSTDVVNLHNELTRSIFSNRLDQTENKLLREETYDASGALLKSLDYTYATTPAYGTTSNPYPWPLWVSLPLILNMNDEAERRWAPMSKRVVTQQGRKFTWQVDATCGSGTAWCFDAYARPTKVTKSSAPLP